MVKLGKKQQLPHPTRANPDEGSRVKAVPLTKAEAKRLAKQS